MKVAIVTFQRTGSYGAVLQMYALQKAIQENIHVESCQVIDYENPVIEKVYKPQIIVDIKNPKNMIKSFLTYFSKKKNWDVFNAIIDDNVDLSRRVDNDNVYSLEDEYDMYIAGSDQVWHTGMNGNNGYYFLDFVNNNKKKYSYAASVGRKKLSSEDTDTYKKWLFPFREISVREKDIALELENLLNRTINVSPDPTLLHEACFWKNIASEININKPYVLIYTVLDPINLYDAASKISRREGISVIVLNGNRRRVPPTFKCINYITPFDFLGYILNAKYILTNSFHASVFSTLFHKEFFAELNQKYIDGGKVELVHNNRIENLLKQTDNISRVITDKDISVVNTDWKKVDDCLFKLRTQGWDYLNFIITDRWENIDK